MNYIDAVLRNPGRFVIRQYLIAYDSTKLLIEIVRSLRNILTVSNLKVLTRQVFFTAIEPLTLVSAGAFMLGAVIVAFIYASLTRLGLSDKAGEFVMTILVDEVAPLFVAIVIMIRSGSAMIAELSLMRLNGEFDSLRSMGIGMHGYLLAPRFVSIVFSSVLLSVFFCFISLFGGFVGVGYINSIPFYDYIEAMAQAASIPDFFAVYVKSFFFGVIIAVVSIKNGLEVRSSITEVPVRLIIGLTRQVIFILIFTLLYDILRYGNIL